jgi:tetratricopeptide (TPR) repeat protein
MRMRAVWLLALSAVLLGLPHSASAQTSRIEQHSEGACSPPITNNQGHITIDCPGVAPEALRYLENQLSDQFQRVSERLRSLDDSARTIRNLNDLNETLRQQADDWARRYRELSARLAESRDDSVQAEQAHALIQRGEFAKAEAILQALADKQEDDVARAAATQYDLGDIAMLRFDPVTALPHYEKAFRYRPDNPRYADGYAEAAFFNLQLPEAEKGWAAALQLYRDLAGHDPSALPALGKTLNKLGILYMGTGRPAKADETISEAVTIYRDLAARDPGSYQPDLALAIANLGNTYLTTGRPTDADKAFSEALTIYRDLAARNPGSHQLQLAATLNLFGNLEVNTGRLADAEKVITEAVTIERDLAARGSDDNRFALAITLDNLGNLYSTAGRLADADKAYSEALTIYRDLAVHGLRAYQAGLAATLSTLGNVYAITGRLADADKAYNEAVTIYRDLAVHAVGTYQAGLAATLSALGNVHATTGRLADAEKAYSEALTIYRDLEASNPAYASNIASLTRALAELRGKLSSSSPPF